MKKHSKICIVTDTWDPQLNGVVTALKHTQAQMEAEGHSVLMVHPGMFTTVPLIFSPEIKFAVSPTKALKKILADFQPDYIHIATEWPLGMAMRRLCLREGLRFTTSFHTHIPNYIAYYSPLGGRWVSQGVYWHLRRFHDPSACVMVATAHLKEELEAHHFKHVEVAPLGVDIELFQRNPSVKNPYKKPVFMLVGRLAVEKNVEEFLEAKLPGTKVLVGDGPAGKRLQKNYPQAEFVGYQSGQALVDFMSMADVMVFPSRTETFGLVIVEALACGVPVAAHPAMGPSDILTHGVDGYLSENLEEAALACLSLSKEACRAKAEKYSWKHAAETFMGHLVLAHDAGGV